jgi:hypothetical protein
LSRSIRLRIAADFWKRGSKMMAWYLSRSLRVVLSLAYKLEARVEENWNILDDIFYQIGDPPAEDLNMLVTFDDLKGLFSALESLYQMVLEGVKKEEQEEAKREKEDEAQEASAQEEE